MITCLDKYKDKIRFCIIGAINTLIDFSILLILNRGFKVDYIVANYISTTIALVFSFFANKYYTFECKGGNVKKQSLSFTIVTLIGLWLIQPLVMKGINLLLVNWQIGTIKLITLKISSDTIKLIIEKLVATVITLIWNYLFYSRLVFKTTPDDNHPEA